jgi:hypothetical protein
MTRIWLLLALGGCLAPKSADCGPDTCPATLVCAGGQCVLPEQVAACNGHPDGSDCRFEASSGVCHGGACQSRHGTIENVPAVSLFALSGSSADDVLAFGSSGTMLHFDGSRWTPLPSLVTQDLHGASRLASGALFAAGQNTMIAWDGTSWARGPVEGPSARTGAMMAYDSARNRLVLFGGGTATDDYADTWEWDGAHWSERANMGPDPRQFGTMVFDSARGRTILFGGGTSGSPPSLYDDTWEWDGTSWTQVASGGPPPRYKGGMTWDSGRSRAVLYAGVGNSKTLNDVWEWDGTAWMGRFAVNGPGPSSSLAFAYDPGRSVSVATQGLTSIGGTPQTWEWDGTSWTGVEGFGPNYDTSPAMAYDAAHAQLVLFGGLDSGTGVSYNDTWQWDGHVWTVLASGGPSPRSGLALAWDAAVGRMIAFGGVDSVDACGDTWAWDGKSWSPTPDLFGIWASSTKVYAVGDLGLWQSPVSGATSGGWQPVAGVAGPLRAIWGNEATGQLFAVGDGGAILMQAADGSFAPVVSSTTERLNGIAGNAAGIILAVGDHGTILRYAGGSRFEPIAPPVSADLYGVWVGATRAFAVGAQGTMLQLDGASWAPVDSATTDDLRAVWSDDATRVFASGGNSTIVALAL